MQRDDVEIADEVEGVAGADVAEDEPSADGTPKKKRTRRGTRGGRGRKKPSAADAAEGEDASPADDNGRPAPRIHVPPAEFTATGDTETDSGDETDSAEETSEPRRGRGDLRPRARRSASALGAAPEAAGSARSRSRAATATALRTATTTLRKPTKARRKVTSSRRRARPLSRWTARTRASRSTFRCPNGSTTSRAASADSRYHAAVPRAVYARPIL